MNQWSNFEVIGTGRLTHSAEYAMLAFRSFSLAPQPWVLQKTAEISTQFSENVTGV